MAYITIWKSLKIDKSGKNNVSKGSNAKNSWPLGTCIHSRKNRERIRESLGGHSVWSWRRILGRQTKAREWCYNLSFFFSPLLPFLFWFVFRLVWFFCFVIRFFFRFVFYFDYPPLHCQTVSHPYPFCSCILDLSTAHPTFSPKPELKLNLNVLAVSWSLTQNYLFFIS